LEGLLAKIIARLMKMLTRLGYLVEEEGVSYIADIDLDPFDCNVTRARTLHHQP
jgi:hypothetical protein